MTELIYTIAEDTSALNRLYFFYSGAAPTSTQLATWATAVGTHWGIDMGGLAHTDVTLDTVKATDLTSRTSANVEVAGSEVGTRAGHALTGGASLLQNSAIIARYRGGHPRTYWPFGVSEDLLDRQSWAAAFLGACVTGLNAFYGHLNSSVWAGGGSLQQCAVLYFTGFTVVINPITGRARNVPKLRTIGGVPTPAIELIDTFTVNPKPAFQRRRDLFVA